MGLSGRNGMLLFAGGVDIAFGAVFILMGQEATLRYAHGAVGVPMWAGIGLIMVGLGLVINVLTSDKKRMRDSLSINLGSLILNLTGMILAACIIGFFTWGAWSVLEVGLSGNNILDNQRISIYTAVILMAVIILLISLVAMFMDCCSYALFGSGSGGDYYGPPRPRYYDGPYGPPPAHIYKQ